MCAIPSYANCSDCGNNRAGNEGEGRSLLNRLQLLRSLTESKAHKAKPGRERKSESEASRALDPLQKKKKV